MGEQRILQLYLFNKYNDNGNEVTVAVLANRNCTACCQQETKAMFLSRGTSHYLLHEAQSYLRS